MSYQAPVKDMLFCMTDAEFMRAEIAVARFYAEHVLTCVPGLRHSVVDGAAAVTELPAGMF